MQTSNEQAREDSLWWPAFTGAILFGVITVVFCIKDFVDPIANGEPRSSNHFALQIADFLVVWPALMIFDLLSYHMPFLYSLGNIGDFGHTGVVLWIFTIIVNSTIGAILIGVLGLIPRLFRSKG